MLVIQLCFKYNPIPTVLLASSLHYTNWVSSLVIPALLYIKQCAFPELFYTVVLTYVSICSFSTSYLHVFLRLPYFSLPLPGLHCYLLSLTACECRLLFFVHHSIGLLCIVRLRYYCVIPASHVGFRTTKALEFVLVVKKMDSCTVGCSSSAFNLG